MNLGAAYEGVYGNNYDMSPATMKFYIDECKRLGFGHIRIPVNWDRPDRILANSPYTINPEFVKELKRTIDYAINKGLYVILDIHNYSKLYANPTAEKPRFLEIWKQIATIFANYPEALVFEVLNEPHGSMTPAIWSDLFTSARDIIRNTPENSNNAKRVIEFSTTDYGGVQSLPQQTLPANDNYTNLTVHYYSPFRFTHQSSWIENSADWAGISWDDTQFERDVLVNDFAYANKLSKQGWPVNIGEFGAYIGADNASRVRYVNYLSKFFTQSGFSWTMWNFGGDFGIYNPVNKSYNLYMVAALTDPTIPSVHTPLNNKDIYTSAFATGNTDGWNAFSNETGAAMKATGSGSNLILNITAPGSNQYSVGLSKQGFKSDRGKKYAVTFTASSTVPMQRIQGTYTETAATATKAAVTSETQFFDLTTTPTKYTMVFTALAYTTTGKMTFYTGGSALPSTITISNLKITEFYDAITLPNSTPPPAPLGTPVTTWDPSLRLDNWGGSSYAATATITGNSAVVNITSPGTAQGNLLVWRRGYTIVAGKKYEIVFKASTTLPTQSLKLTARVPGFTDIQLGDFTATGTLNEFRAQFVAPGATSSSGNFYIFFSGASGPSTLNVQNAELYDISNL